MEFYRKGQGATEYLVLLAVVLIIALVSIALLGFFPGLATDARAAQSSSYWKGEARPFAILEHSVVATTGVATLILQNVDASGSITLTNVTIGGNSTVASPLPLTFAPGETRSFTYTMGATGQSPGIVYEYPVNFTYSTPTGLTLKQYGVKNIIGKYS